MCLRLVEMLLGWKENKWDNVYIMRLLPQRCGELSLLTIASIRVRMWFQFKNVALVTVVALTTLSVASPLTVPDARSQNNGLLIPRAVCSTSTCGN